MSAAELDEISPNVKAIASSRRGGHDLKRDGALHFGVALSSGFDEVIGGEVHHDEFAACNKTESIGAGL